MDEIWKPIADFEGYEVSNRGRVRSIKKPLKPVILSLQKTKRGYLKVMLHKGPPGARIHKNCRVHVLVLSAFIGPRPAGLEGDHINRVKTDNSIENLRWVTPEENKKNIDWACSKFRGRPGTLTAEDAVAIAAIKGTRTAIEIAASYGVHANTILDIFHGRSWSHATGLTKRERRNKLTTYQGR